MTTTTLYADASNRDADWVNDVSTLTSDEIGSLPIDIEAERWDWYSSSAGFVFDMPSDIAGATINSAYVRFNVYSSDGIWCDIRAKNSSDSQPFAIGDATVPSLVSTSIEWHATSSIGTGWQNSPELKTLLQDVVDNAGLVNSGGVTIYFYGRYTGISSSAARKTTVLNYDWGTSYRAELYLDYTPDTGGSGIVLPVVSGGGIHSAVFGRQVIR